MASNINIRVQDLRHPSAHHDGPVRSSLVGVIVWFAPVIHVVCEAADHPLHQGNAAVVSKRLRTQCTCTVLRPQWLLFRWPTNKSLSPTTASRCCDCAGNLHGGELRIDAKGLQVRRQARDGAVRTVVFGQPLGVVVPVGRGNDAGHKDRRGRTARC